MPQKLVPDPPARIPSHPPISPAPSQAEAQDKPTTWSTAGHTSSMELYRIQPGTSFQHAFSELSVLLGRIGRTPKPLAKKRTYFRDRTLDQQVNAPTEINPSFE